MKVAGLIDDLFFTAKLREVAQSLGAETTICRSADGVPADVSRIIVDLSAITFDPVEEIRKLKASHSAPLTAFFSHVQIDIMERAEKAGADEIVPRSVFAKHVAEIIQR